MEFTCEIDSLLAALNDLAGVIPARSPKPILRNVLIDLDPELGSRVLATNLDLGIRVRLLGVEAKGPGRVVLPPDRLKTILALARGRNDRLTFRDGEDGDFVRIGGAGVRYDLPREDPALYPDVPDFTGSAYEEVGSGDLRRLIERTSFATDEDSTRYALSGTLLEVGDGRMTMVGTDGRRLALQTVSSSPEGGGAPRGGGAVLPVKFLRLLGKLTAPDDPPAHVTFERRRAKDGDDPSASPLASALVRTERAVVWTRLVEGRYPRYQDVLEAAGGPHRASVAAGDLLLACQQAQVTTSEETRGVDFTFSADKVTLSGQSADVGSSEVEAALAYQGPPMTVTFDPRYLVDALRALAPEAPLVLAMNTPKHPAELTGDEGWRYVVMPLTRDG